MSSRGEQFFAAIENDTALENEVARASAFEEAMKAFEVEGNLKRAEQCKYEVVIFNFFRSESDRVGEHFLPIFEYEGGASWPDLSKVSPGFREYITKRADETSNPIHKSWYCDFLWDKYKDHRRGLKATEAYLECIRLYRSALRDDDLYHAIRRGVYLARTFKQTALYPSLETEIMDTLTTLEQAGERHWLSRISEYLPLVPGVGQANLEVARTILRRTADWFQSAHEFHAQRFTLEGLVELEQFRGEQAEVKRLRVEIGESYVQEGDRRSTDSNLVAAHWYQTAINHFGSIGHTQPIPGLRVKLESAGVKAGDEAKPIEVAIPISTDRIDAYVAEFTKGTLSSALHAFGLHFVPSVEQTKSLIDSLKRQSPIQFRVSHTLSSSRGMIVARPESEGEREKYHLYRQLFQRIQISAAVFQSRVLQALKDTKGLNAETMTSHLVQTDLFRGRDNALLENGVKRYFDEDYIGAIHILVPQVEDVLRGCLVRLGVPATGPNPNVSGGMLAKTLGTILNDPVLNKNLGEDMVTYMRVVFSESFGHNIRNEIAHGLLDVGQFTQTMCEIVIQVLLMLAALSVVPLEEA